MQSHKSCCYCKLSKPLSEFHRQAKAVDGHQNRCKLCAIALARKWQTDHKDRVNKKNAEWKRKNPKKVSFMMHRDRLRRFYGMSVDEYHLAVQGGVCAICEQPSPNKTRLAVDHDHKTGQIRGLLCSLCNHALGQVERVLNWTKRAEFYLWSHSGSLPPATRPQVAAKGGSPHTVPLPPS